MGLLWDLIQHGQIREQADRSATLEDRVAQLERELRDTRELLVKALERLEEHLKTDVDGDGRVGR
jgi:hypothetical protein